MEVWEINVRRTSQQTDGRTVNLPKQRNELNEAAFILSIALLLPCFRNCENKQRSACVLKLFFMTTRGGGFNKTGEAVEHSAGFARMFETVTRASSIGVVAHHLGESQRGQHVADPRHAPAHGSCDFAWRHLFVLRQQPYHREGHWVSQDTTEPRFPVMRFIHAARLSCFWNCENKKLSLRQAAMDS